MSRKRAFASTILLVGILAVVPGRASADDAGIGVEIGPARVEQDLVGRAISRDFLVVNHEAESRAITMSVAGLGHDLDGSPEFLEPAAATSVLHLNATTFTLHSGERKTVHMSGLLPTGAHSLYAAVIAEFAPLTKPKGVVESRSRVASLLLYRGPKPWIETTSVVDVGLASQQGTRRLKVYASIKDTGNVHVRPTGSVKITQDGRVLTTVRLTSQLIIPGFARRLTGVWTPPLGFNGPVSLDATTDGGGHANTSAALTKGSIAASPTAKIQDLRGRDARGGLVTLDVVNTGTTDVAPTVTLIATQDGIERSRVVLPQPRLSPGTSVPVEWKPGLAPGLYVIIAQLNDGDILLDQTITALPIGLPGGGSGTTTSRHGSSVAWDALGAILLLLLVAFAVWARRRRAPGPVDLPTADASEPSEEWRRASGL